MKYISLGMRLYLLHSHEGLQLVQLEQTLTQPSLATRRSHKEADFPFGSKSL